ncbi:MAG: helix-turn-helix transcriptional regulator [Oscillospiraceae bacterium]
MKQEYYDRYRKLGLNIAYYRKLKGFTQDQLSEKMDIDQTHLSKIEVAGVGVSLDKLFLLADILGIPVHELFVFRD